jgi:8-oxo-dGTP pyrophosphatase MutT (NUDIX family)
VNEATDPGAELVEEIDEYGRVVRVVTRAEMRAGNLRHRNVGVVVRRGTGAVVVHERAHWKDVHPSLWDIVFGGVPGVGESDLDAAVRELAEEAGLTAQPTDLEEFCRASAEDEHTRWVGHFYIATTDDALFPADGEVAQMVEIPIDELAAWAVATPLCPDVEPLVQMVLERLG